MVGHRNSIVRYRSMALNLLRDKMLGDVIDNLREPLQEPLRVSEVRKLKEYEESIYIMDKILTPKR